MEKIIRIAEVFGVKLSEDSWRSFEGFEIMTDSQKIQILISDQESCCENYGQLCSEDDFSKFIGATLNSITTTDTSLMTEKVGESDYYSDDGGGIIFVNLETSEGTLQFAVYNSHNGYYGHSVRIISNQLNLEDSL